MVDGSATSVGKVAAFCTSLRFEPVWLATRLILPFVWPWPFFLSAVVGFASAASSCPAVARDALGGIGGGGKAVSVCRYQGNSTGWGIVEGGRWPRESAL